MDDYIKRLDVRDVIAKMRRVLEQSKVGNKLDDLCDAVCDLISEGMEQIPAADVRENVRGEWKNTVAFHIECSECGCTISANKGIVFFTHDSEYNFCPNCGAYMRGDKK